MKFRYCLGVSAFTVSLLITPVLAEDRDFEIGHFLQLLDLLDLEFDLASGHRPYDILSYFVCRFLRAYLMLLKSDYCGRTDVYGR